jgi:hypothetical protein
MPMIGVIAVDPMPCPMKWYLHLVYKLTFFTAILREKYFFAKNETNNTGINRNFINKSQTYFIDTDNAQEYRYRYKWHIPCSHRNRMPVIPFARVANPYPVSEILDPVVFYPLDPGPIFPSPGSGNFVKRLSLLLFTILVWIVLISTGILLLKLAPGNRK